MTRLQKRTKILKKYPEIKESYLKTKAGSVKVYENNNFEHKASLSLHF